MEQAIRGARNQSGLAAAPLQDPNYGSAKPGIRRQRRSDFALKSGRRERNFWMRRQGAKNSRQNARTPAETKIREVRGRKSPQKRPIWRRGTEFLDAETRRQKSPPKLVSAHRDKNPGNQWPEIPAETPYLAS